MRLSRLLCTLFCALVFVPPVGLAQPNESTARLQLLRRTKHFDVYLAPGSLRRSEALKLADWLEPTLASVAQRFGTPFTARERIEIRPAQKGPCAVRGLTFSGKRLIQLFFESGADPERIRSLVAHELVHQLQRERFGDRVHQAADNILLEGWAVLASDNFARTPDGADPRWRARLREVVARNELQPLRVNLQQDCRTNTRNIMYDQWASFVDFLEKEYGNEALARVYSKGKGRVPGSANYKLAFGKPFEELEAEWRKWVVTQ